MAKRINGLLDGKINIVAIHRGDDGKVIKQLKDLLPVMDDEEPIELTLPIPPGGHCGMVFHITSLNIHSGYAIGKLHNGDPAIITWKGNDCFIQPYDQTKKVRSYFT